MTLTRKMTAELRKKLEALVGETNVVSDPEKVLDYGHDEFSLKEIARTPELVVKPAATEEVAGVLKVASAHGIPVTPRGGGTGLCGGCVPSPGGIVLSLERMNRIVEIDVESQTATAEAGVRLSDFTRAVEHAGLSFPPHPGDESAMLGGLVATNAGGSRAVKYGTIRNYVRGLEVVLPSGEVVQLGGKYVKSSTGYNLMHLMIGSEGTLGVVTRAVLQLHAKPAFTRTFVVPYAGLMAALSTMSAVLKKGITPLAVEFLEVEPIIITEEHLNLRWPSRLGKTHLMIIIEAFSEEDLDRMSQDIGDVCIENGAVNVFIADSASKQEEVLSIRSKIYDAIKPGTIEILDISLPRSEVGAHVRRVKEVAEKFGVWLPTFGHAADGNVHTHIMKARYEEGKMVPVPEEEWRPKVEPVREALFQDCRARGGVISGEHGIGLVKKPYLHLSLGPAHIELMRGIKKVFDPAGIMNPGKIFDLE